MKNLNNVNYICQKLHLRDLDTPLYALERFKLRRWKVKAMKNVIKKHFTQTKFWFKHSLNI